MTVLRAEGLGKLYRLYRRRADFLKERLLGGHRHRELWALRDVDFELAAGESLGVIGVNGAGKTTLLKLAAGTVRPSAGRIARRGRVTTLLALGSGFHPELSGRDNVRLGCAVQGLSPSETGELLPEILAFAELEEAADRPVKTYSAGMFVRLAFSVATAASPEVLVIDETLSVGDQRFQKKCIDRIMSFRARRVTLLFCSHSMYLVNALCSRCLWLDGGRPRMLGPSAEVTAAYEDFARESDAAPTVAAPDRASRPAPGDGAARLETVRLAGEAETYRPGDRLRLEIRARVAAERRDDLHVAVILLRNDDVRVYAVTTLMDGAAPAPLGSDRVGVDFVVDRLPLLAGKYRFDVYLLDASGVHSYDRAEGAVTFTVRSESGEGGIVRLDHRWSAPG